MKGYLLGEHLVAIVAKFMGGGSLHSVIKVIEKTDTYPVGWSHLTTACCFYGIAQGMRFMHDKL